MDDAVPLVLWTDSGVRQSISSKRSATVRSVLAAAHLEAPPNSYPVCIWNGLSLQLDLPLSVQGVNGSADIFIVYRPNSIPRGNVFEDDNRRQQQLYEEALRVSDISFFMVEASRHGDMLYKSMLVDQCASDQDSEADDEITLTVIDESGQKNHIPSEPLPKCWRGNEKSDGHSMCRCDYKQNPKQQFGRK
jgi:hypothetical protein